MHLKYPNDEPPAHAATEQMLIDYSNAMCEWAQARIKGKSHEEIMAAAEKADMCYYALRAEIRKRA